MERKRPLRTRKDQSTPIIELDSTQIDVNWIKYMDPTHPLRRPGETDAEFLARNPIAEYLDGKIDINGNPIDNRMVEPPGEMQEKGPLDRRAAALKRVQRSRGDRLKPVTKKSTFG